MTQTTRTTPSTQATIVRPESFSDFLALVPELIGMTPRESVVLVAFSGKRTHGALRMDLPQTRDAKAIARFANTYVGMVCKIQGADGVIPILYSNRSFADEGGLPDRQLLQRIVARAKRAGLAVKDAACVASDGYGSLFDDDLPAGGYPRSDLELNDDDEPFGTDRHSLDLDAEVVLALLEADEGEHQRFEDAVAYWKATPGDEWDSLIGGFLDGRDPTECLESVLYPRELDELDGWLPMLAAIADFPILRDVALLQFGWGRAFGQYTFDRTVTPPRKRLGAGDLTVLALSGGDMARPDRARIELAIERVTAAALLRPRVARAPLVTMLAWLHWALGRGSIAGAFVDAALRIDPDYGLADLLHIMLDRGMVPEWSYRTEPLNPESRPWVPSQEE